MIILRARNVSNLTLSSLLTGCGEEIFRPHFVELQLETFARCIVWILGEVAIENSYSIRSCDMISLIHDKQRRKDTSFPS
mmetsp:Transcript_43579/g.44265  ORF Transcript_43579/g.44265 Transcript_43579/m.44265 type:complete len:80 (-) Transcript_43579:467-706(-)